MDNDSEHNGLCVFLWIISGFTPIFPAFPVYLVYQYLRRRSCLMGGNYAKSTYNQLMEVMAKLETMDAEHPGASV